MACLSCMLQGVLVGGILGSEVFGVSLSYPPSLLQVANFSQADPDYGGRIAKLLEQHKTVSGLGAHACIHTQASCTRTHTLTQASCTHTHTGIMPV